MLQRTASEEIQYRREGRDDAPPRVSESSNQISVIEYKDKKNKIPHKGYETASHNTRRMQLSYHIWW